MTRRHAPLAAPEFGWDRPWPNLFELARALPGDKWTLVGGLMVQAHTLAHGISVIRPTDDLDVLLHIEVLTGVVADTHTALTSLGYELLARRSQMIMALPRLPSTRRRRGYGPRIATELRPCLCR